MEITNDVFNAITRYFHTLHNLGYKKDRDVNNLLIYIYIEELLYGRMSEYVTEKDYNNINKVLYCLYGTSCMFPYPDYRKVAVDNISPGLYNKYRVAENGILRSTEFDSIRIPI